MDEVRLFDSNTIDVLPFPKTKEGLKTRGYLLPLIKEGVESYITNVKTKLYALTINDCIIPISVNEKEYDNSYVASTFFVLSFLKEKLKKDHPILAVFLRPVLFCMESVLKALKVNKVVVVNNWLLPTNLYPALTAQDVEKIAAFLKERFPDHLITFRSVNTYRDSTLFNSLKDFGFRMIKSREIFLYDPNMRHELSNRAASKNQKEYAMISEKNYQVMEAKEISDAEFSRLVELYRQIYVSKYTKYSPGYTERFLKHLTSNDLITLKALKKEGNIYGFSGYLTLCGMLVAPFFGYDTNLPKSEGLYRMLSTLIIHEADEKGIIANESSGASKFKRWRGMQTHLEYIAVYDQHLPIRRRFFWAFSEKIMNKIVVPLLQRKEQKNKN